MAINFNLRFTSSSQKLRYDIADAMATSIPACMSTSSAQMVPATAMVASSADLLGPQLEATLAPSLMDSCQTFSQPEYTLSKPLVNSSLFLASSKMPIDWYIIGPHDYIDASSVQTQLMAKVQSDIQDCLLESLSPPSSYDGPSRTQSSADFVESQLRKLVIHADDGGILHGVNYHFR